VRKISLLSDREREIIAGIGEGSKTKKIAERLFISENHRQAPPHRPSFKKLKVHRPPGAESFTPIATTLPTTRLKWGLLHPGTKCGRLNRPFEGQFGRKKVGENSYQDGLCNAATILL